MLERVTENAETQANPRPRSGMFALAAAAVFLLVVDVALLTLVVRAASTSARVGRPARLSAPALPPAAVGAILPTRDPRTPRPTRTPTGTITGAPTSSPTAESRLAVPVGPSSTPPQLGATSTATSVPAVTASYTLNSARATRVPDLRAASTTMITAPTPTIRTDAMPTGGVRTAAPSPTSPESVLPTEAPATETPTSSPTETIEPTATETPPPPEPASFDDLPALESYIRSYRSKVAGVSFDIVSLTVDTTSGAAPRFVLEVTASQAKDVFAAQSADAITEYGRGLLDDVKSYLGGGYCEIAVESTYQTSDSGPCSSMPAWCRLGAQDQANSMSTVTRTYVRGSYTGGPDALETWITGP